MYVACVWLVQRVCDGKYLCSKPDPNDLPDAELDAVDSNDCILTTSVDLERDCFQEHGAEV